MSKTSTVESSVEQHCIEDESQLLRLKTTQDVYKSDKDVRRTLQESLTSMMIILRKEEQKHNIASESENENVSLCAVKCDSGAGHLDGAVSRSSLGRKPKKKKRNKEGKKKRKSNKSKKSAKSRRRKSPSHVSESNSDKMDGDQSDQQLQISKLEKALFKEGRVPWNKKSSGESTLLEKEMSTCIHSPMSSLSYSCSSSSHSSDESGVRERREQRRKKKMMTRLRRRRSVSEEHMLEEINREVRRERAKRLAPILVEKVKRQHEELTAIRQDGYVEEAGSRGVFENGGCSSRSAQLPRKNFEVVNLKLTQNSFHRIKSGESAAEAESILSRREDGEVSDDQTTKKVSGWIPSADHVTSSTSKNISQGLSALRTAADDKKRRRSLSSSNNSRNKQTKLHHRHRRDSDSSSDSSSSHRNRKRRRSRSRSHELERRYRSRHEDRPRRHRSRSQSIDRRDLPKDPRVRSRSRTFGWFQGRAHRGAETERRRRSRSKTSAGFVERLAIDKQKLRRRAIATVLRNMKAGMLKLDDLRPDEVASFRAGGVELSELTDVCRRISEKQAALFEAGFDEEDVVNLPYCSSDEADADADKSLTNRHPFELKNQNRGSLSSAINISIRNAKQLPVQTSQEKLANTAVLRSAFPVSSGILHRANEGWVPVVDKDKPAESCKNAAPPSSQETIVVDDDSVHAAGLITTAAQAASAFAMAATDNMMAPPPAPAPRMTGASIAKAGGNPTDSIQDILSQRISAMRRLADNPADRDALNTMLSVNESAKVWADRSRPQSMVLPDSVLSNTFSSTAPGLTPLSKSELDAGNAWFKKDQFFKAPPVRGGVGHYLLKKMGWREGQGLGRHNEGDTTPLMIDFKVDRKGLAGDGENFKKPMPGTRGAVIHDFNNKHPITAITELSKRRRWGQIEFALVHESGPPHLRNFVYSVKVNGVEYQPTVASRNKKDGKAAAATVALQELGMIPKDT